MNWALDVLSSRIFYTGLAGFVTTKRYSQTMCAIHWPIVTLGALFIGYYTVGYPVGFAMLGGMSVGLLIGRTVHWVGWVVCYTGWNIN